MVWSPASALNLYGRIGYTRNLYPNPSQTLIELCEIDTLCSQSMLTILVGAAVPSLGESPLSDFS